MALFTIIKNTVMAAANYGITEHKNDVLSGRNNRRSDNGAVIYARPLASLVSGRDALRTGERTGGRTGGRTGDRSTDRSAADVQVRTYARTHVQDARRLPFAARELF